MENRRTKLVVSKDLLRIPLARPIVVKIPGWAIVVYKWILRVSDCLNKVLL